jgi:hypothetical protein
MKCLQQGLFTNRKRAKNTFSLESFGHSVQSTSAPGPTSSLNACAGNLTADGRRAAVRVLPLQHSRSASQSASESAPAINLDDNEDWLDVSMDEPPPTGYRHVSEPAETPMVCDNGVISFDYLWYASNFL